MIRRSMHFTVRSKMVSLLVGLMLLTAGVGGSVGAPKQRGPINVGMIPLLASPQKYNGKIIQTIGFLNIGSMRENDDLWLYEDDGKFSLYKNSFALDLSDDQRTQFIDLNHTYVLIEGTLHSKGPEGTNMNSGIIVHITRLAGWHPYRPFLPATPK
ncbi:MAG: hypothetical protein LAO31_23235 [Acidobacteriia bacterium]|nr:hypothetical protein [Terriglobia bacterium]